MSALSRALSSEEVDDTLVINTLAALAAVAQRGEEGARSIMGCQGELHPGLTAPWAGTVNVHDKLAQVSACSVSLEATTRASQIPRGSQLVITCSHCPRQDMLMNQQCLGETALYIPGTSGKARRPRDECLGGFLSGGI